MWLCHQAEVANDLGVALQIMFSVSLFETFHHLIKINVHQTAEPRIKKKFIIFFQETTTQK